MNNSMTRRLSGAVILAVAFGPVPAGAQTFPPEEALELVLRYQVEDGPASGMALGLLEADGSTRVLTHGTGGPEAGPIGPESVFELGDLTMTFTATLLALMAERGEVSLDDPVSAYLPDSVRVPSLSGRLMTLHDLALHKSGLPAEPPEAYHRFTVDDLYAFLSGYDPRYAPGQEFEYSPLGYGLLGHALARAAGTSLPALLHARVLEPLGMLRTGYGAGGGSVVGRGGGPIGDPEGKRARGDGADDAVSGAPTAAMLGATGLRSTPADMVAYLRANARPDDTDLGRAMRVAQEVRGSNAPSGEGHGFSWRQYVEGRQPLLVTHGGQTDGFSSLITFDRERGVGTVVLANSGDARPWSARNLLWLGPWTVDPAAVDVDPERARAYTGTYSTTVGKYRAADGGHHYVRLEPGGHLTYQRPDGIRRPLLPRSDSAFYMVDAPFTLTFTPSGDGMQMIAAVDRREPPRTQGRRWRAWRVDTATPPPPGQGAPRSVGSVLLAAFVGVAVLAGAAPFWLRRRQR